jgi:hypothetical protein
VNTNGGYLLSNRRVEADARLGALSELFDPVTFRHLDRLGIAPGWRCWEVGAGTLSVPKWLAGRAGPAGRVLATDIDTAHLRAEPPIEVRTHVPERDLALHTMIGALRPGGWLLIEDADPMLQPLACPDETGPAQRLANRLRDAFRALLADRGADLAFGRKLPRLLREAGLSDVRADGFFPIGSPACAELEALTINQVRDGLVTSGRATDEEIETLLAAIAEGTLDFATAPMISAWGRRLG